MAIGVYGLYLSQQAGAFQRGLGRAILAGAQWMMKSLPIVGKAAMFMVGGGILVHGVPALGEMLHHAGEAAHGLPGVGGVLGRLANPLGGVIAGIVAGGIVFMVVSRGQQLFKR